VCIVAIINHVFISFSAVQIYDLSCIYLNLTLMSPKLADFIGWSRLNSLTWGFSEKWRENTSKCWQLLISSVQALGWKARWRNKILHTHLLSGYNKTELKISLLLRAIYQLLNFKKKINARLFFRSPFSTADQNIAVLKTSWSFIEPLMHYAIYVFSYVVVHISGRRTPNQMRHSFSC